MTTQPAGEHHTGTLNLAGEGNEAEVSPEAVRILATRYGHGCGRSEPSASDTEVAKAMLAAALPALRRQIAEEIAVAIERSEDSAARREQAEGIAGNPDGAQGWSDIATGYMRSAELAREVGTR